MPNNLGIMLGGAVQQRNTSISQGLQERALAAQEQRDQQAQRQQQFAQIQENFQGLFERAQTAIEQSGSDGGISDTIVSQAKMLLPQLQQQAPEQARMIEAMVQAGLSGLQATPTPEQAAIAAAQASATGTLATRDALVSGGLDPASASATAGIRTPDPTAPVDSGMFDDRGRANPTTQRLVQSTVGSLYGATFDEAGNFVLPGDANQLREATEVTAEAIRILEAMPEIMTPAEASLVAQRNIRSRIGITGGTETGGAAQPSAPGASPDNPLPPPSSQADLQDGNWYQDRQGNPVQFRDGKFYDRDGQEIQ